MLRKLAAALAVIALVVLALAGWLWWRVGQVAVDQVSADVWMISGIGSNVAVLRTEAGTVVVDTMAFPRQGAEILERAEGLAGGPVALILNTHYHFDHTHGNPAFAPGTKVVSTRRTLDHLRRRDADFWRDPPASELLPNDTFDGPVWEMRVGNKTIRAHHGGRGHTDGDLLVHFVEDRVLCAGDLFFNGRYPNIDLEAGGSVREWPQTMQRVLDLGIDFGPVIPGHGEVSDRVGYERFRDFLQSLWAQTSAIAARGGSLEDALAEVDLERFDMATIWYAPGLDRDFVVRRAWEEAAASRGPS